MTTAGLVQMRPPAQRPNARPQLRARFRPRSAPKDSGLATNRSPRHQPKGRFGERAAEPPLFDAGSHSKRQDVLGCSMRLRLRVRGEVAGERAATQAAYPWRNRLACDVGSHATRPPLAVERNANTAVRAGANPSVPSDQALATAMRALTPLAGAGVRHLQCGRLILE